MKNYEEMTDTELIKNLQYLESMQKREAADELHIYQIKLEIKNRELKELQIELELSRSRYKDFYDAAERDLNGHKDVEEQIKNSNLELTKTNEQLIKVRNELEMSEKLFHGLFDNMTSGSGIYHVINDGTRGSDYIIRVFNRASLQMEGKSHEDVAGRSLSDLRPNIDDYGLIPVMKKVWETGEPAFFPVKIYEDEHFSRYYENHIFRLPSGEVVTIYNDVTEHMETEYALRESESKFRDMFLSHAAVMLLIDCSTGKILDANQSAVRFYGYPMSRLLDMNITDINSLLPEKVAKHYKEAALKIYNTFVFPHRLASGEIRTVEVHSSPIVQNGVRVLFSIIHDITERRLAEEALRESEEKFRIIANYTVDWESWFAPDGKYIWVNPDVENITGYSPEEILAMPDFISILIAEEDRDMFARRFQDALSGSSGENFEFRYIHRNGSKLWLNVSWKPIVDMKGTFLGIRSSGRDITGRKQAEESLSESEERFRAVSEYSHNAICIIDEKARIIWVNNKMIEISGYTREQISGADSFLSFLAPESVEFVVSNYMKFVAGEPYEHYYQFYFIRADGEKRLVEKYMTGCTDKKGNRNLIISMLDVTERKRDEEERQKLQGQLTHAQKMESVGRLAGGVAHDFNNMLGIILGCVELSLYDLKPSDPLFANIERIRRAAERSANLTRQLLAFARRQMVSPTVLDLNYTVDGMLKMLRRIIGEDIDMVWKPACNLEPVKMDPAQIDQIMANLLVNARDAIAGVGRVIIETGHAVFDEAYCASHTDFMPGEYVKLSVSDNGCGMNSETLANIFEPFFTTKELGKGTGLGLATVYGIVRQNNGFINVYSEPGTGTTFTIYLPRYAGETGPASAKNPEEKVKGGHETVLIVEDEKILLELAEAMLKQLGYTVLTANTPAYAISLAGKYAGKIHLLITDVVMPEMNGRDLATHLLSQYQNLRCLFMSGYTANVIAHHGVLDKGVHFVQKPFSRKDLAARVREALDQKHGTGELQEKCFE